MNVIITWKSHLLLNILVGGLLFALNSPTWLIASLGLILFLYWAFIIGQIFHRRQNLSLSNIIGLTYLIAFISVLGFTTIHLQFFSIQYCWLIAIVVALLTSFGLYRKPLAFTLPLNNLPRPKNVIFSLSYLLFSFVAWQQLYLSATTEALRSPWQVTPQLFFVAYALASLCLIFAIRFSKVKTAVWHLLGLSLHFFLSICASLTIYKLGADYDPFIHQANIDLLLKNGQLLPTPIYYLGQYALTIFLNALTKINTATISAYLLPVLASITLPALFYNLGKVFNLKNNLLVTLSCLSLFVLPLKTFTVTTPQAIANLFALTAIVLTIMAVNKKISLWPAWFAIIIACSTHLIAGLPVAAILAYISIDQIKLFNKWPSKLTASLKIEMLLAAILILPIAFLVNAQKTASQLKVDVIDQPWQKLYDLIINAPSLKFLNYISVHDFVYNFSNWRWLFILTLTIAGYFVIKTIAEKKVFTQLVIAFGTLVIASGILTISIDFFSLVSGEKNIYPQRLLELAIYCITPLVFFGAYGLWHKLTEQTRSHEVIAIVLLVTLTTSNLYLNFPRVDRLSENHGYSTSQTDLDTVKFIDKLASEQKYIVLASQPVSAAAINSFSFAHYYNDYFYYPVPTGGRMYQLYEDLAFSRVKPSEVINTARYLTGVQDVYFVLNRYWSGADESIIFYKNTADAWYAINDKNYIFVYKNNDVIDNMADKRLKEINK
jgi:hypothetical protein